MPHPPSSPRQLHSWRGTGRAQQRSAPRWIGTLVVLASLALLGYLLWRLLPGRLPHTHLLAIATGEAHRFTVPPIPFASEDLAPLAETSAHSYRFHDFSRLQEAANIRDLGQLVQGLPVQPKDVLIVYVSAVGVSLNGNAVLLCRDYDLQHADAGYYTVAELLGQLKQTTAATKLLVLDAAWVLADPRLGFVINAFPVLLADEVARHDDPDLWVLLSCSLLQTPMVLYAEQQTVFGRSFADGLLGGADLTDRGGDEDGFIALDELFRYVAEACRRETAGLQKPVVLRAGRPLDQLTRIPPGVQLARADLLADTGTETETPAEDATTPEAATESQEAAARKDEASRPSAPVSAAADDAQAAADPAKDARKQSAAKGTAAPPSAAEDSPARGENTGPSGGQLPGADSGLSLPALLHRAWQLRDQLEALPETAGRWSPVEYAPHQWREWNALLVDIDLQSRAGATFNPPRLREELRIHLDGLRQLQREDWSATATGDRSLVTQRLLISAARFARSPARQSFATDSRELREVGAAVRGAHRLSYRLPDYVQCHGEIVMRWPDCPALDALSRHLEQIAVGLLQFQTDLRAREGQRLVVSAAADPLVVLARNLQQTEDAVRALLQQQVDVLAANADQPVVRHRVTGLLRTAVWPAGQRKRLVAGLGNALDPDRQAPPDASPFPQQLAVPARQWDWIARHLRLQARVMQLAGLPETADLEPQLDVFQAARPSGPGDDSQLWHQARQLGQICRDFHLALRQRVREAGGQRNMAPTRWLDARDAHVLAAADLRPGFLELRLLPPQRPERVDVAHQPPGAVRIDSDQVAIDLTVRATNRSLRSVSLTPDFNDQQLLVQQAERGQPLRRGRPLSLPLDASGQARLQLVVNAASGPTETAGGGQYDIDLQVRAGNQTVPYTIQCVVPKPNEVDLIVERIAPRARARRFGRNGTELRPLVNRTSYFRIMLANLAEQDKQVDVALYRVPGSDWSPGRLVDQYGEPFVDVRSWLFQTGTDRLLPGVEPVAQTAQPLALPADARPREVDLSRPAAPPAEPPAKADAAAATKAEPEPAAEPARIDISYGLACVITNAADPAERWIKWIEINPLLPHEYVQPLVAYDPALGQVTIAVRGLDADGDGQPDRFPSRAMLAEQPITVSWDTAGVVPPGAERNDRAVIARPDAVGRLSARVPSHPTRTAVIRLHVDGYPRAFLYELALNRQNEGRDIRRDARSVRITSLRMQGGNRLFRTTPRDPLPEPEPGDAETDVEYLQPGVPAAFGVPGPSNALLVGFEVDAPLDAFAFRDRNDAVEVGFTRPGFPPVRLYSDRRTQAWLEEVTAAGFAVSTQVGDYVEEQAVPLDIAGLRNARLKIQARLEVDRDDPPPHALEVVLDGEAPALGNLSVPAAVDQGQPLPVSLDVTDLAGPAKAAFGIVDRRSDELPEDQAVVREQFSATAPDRWPISVSLDTSKHEPGVCFLKAWVIDRVGKRTETVAELVINAPQPMKKDKQPLVGTIRGVVRFGPTFQPDRITVRIKDSTIAPATTANGGRFRFDNVPAGTYTLEARGPVRGYIKQGTTQVELMSKEDYAREIAIELTDP